MGDPTKFPHLNKVGAYVGTCRIHIQRYTMVTRGGEISCPLRATYPAAAAANNFVPASAAAAVTILSG